MEVILDGDGLTEELSGENLKEIIEDLCCRVLDQDRTLKELLINGRPYEEQSMGLPQDISRQGIQKLEVTTISSWEVAQHFLSSADVTLKSMIDGAKEVAELFRVSDEQEANEQYLRLLESLGLFLNMVQQSQHILKLDFNSILADGISAAERLEKLKELTGEMLSAQEKEDWVLLADITGYDLARELEAWRGLTQAFFRQGASEA